MSVAPVLIMAGGTGGHIFPGLAVAEVLRAEGVPVAWLGAAGGLEQRLVPAHGFDLHSVPVSALRGQTWWRRLRAPWMLVRALFASFGVLKRLRPRSVLSLGGFVAGPGGVAAWLGRYPLLVHEQNAVAGFTNRCLARLAGQVLVGFPGGLGGATWTGNPVRVSITTLPPPAQRFAKRSGPPRVLVLGGSLGARSLNKGVAPALAELAMELRPQVRHQCGGKGLAETQAAYAAHAIDAEVSTFIDDMAAAYAWADLVICRAGALTLAEICAAGLASILVPYPHAVDDHQTRNADTLVQAGAARMLADADLDAASLARELSPLLAQAPQRLAMAEAARALAKPDAAAEIARYCMQVVS